MADMTIKEVEQILIRLENENIRDLSPSDDNRIDAIFALAASALRQLLNAQKWREIETAPKGSGGDVRDPDYVEPPRILLRFGDEAISVAYWDWYYAEGGYGYRDGFAWIEPCSGSPLNGHYSAEPDGWLPLPSPPQEKENGDG